MNINDKSPLFKIILKACCILGILFILTTVAGLLFNLTAVIVSLLFKISIIAVIVIAVLVFLNKIFKLKK